MAIYVQTHTRMQIIFIMLSTPCDDGWPKHVSGNFYILLLNLSHLMDLATHSPIVIKVNVDLKAIPLSLVTLFQTHVILSLAFLILNKV